MLRAPKTCATWAKALQNAVERSACARPVLVGRRWDDLRFAGLKLIFLIVSGAVSLLGRSRWKAWRKDAEILMLRHQLAVAGRGRPGARTRLTWPDRTVLALLTRRCRPAMRLIGSRAPSCGGTGTSPATGARQAQARPGRHGRATRPGRSPCDTSRRARPCAGSSTHRPPGRPRRRQRQPSQASKSFTRTASGHPSNSSLPTSSQSARPRKWAHAPKPRCPAKRGCGRS